MSEKDLQTLEQRIADKVGKELIDLIPEHEWQKLVSNQIDYFKTTKAPKILQELFEQEFKKYTTNLLSRLLGTQTWDNLLQEYTYPEIEKYLIASGQTLFTSMMSPVLAMALQDFRNRIGYS